MSSHFAGLRSGKPGINTARAADTTGEKGGDAMGILEPERTDAGPHPRREPRFDGPLTYKNAKKTVEVARIVPLERVLLETDSPYMSPVPVRGTRNDSRNVFHIAAKFAELRGMEVDEVIALTSENGKRLFGIE